jgi:hypothetical protein
MIAVSKKSFFSNDVKPFFLIGLLNVVIIMILVSLSEKQFNMFIFLGVTALAVSPFLILKYTFLEIQFDHQYITYGWRPFHRKKIEIENLDKIEWLSVNALGDFWGTGYKFSKKYGYGFITGSGKAIKLYFKHTPKTIVLSIDETIIDDNLLKFLAPYQMPKISE